MSIFLFDDHRSVKSILSTRELAPEALQLERVLAQELKAEDQLEYSEIKHGIGTDELSLIMMQIKMHNKCCTLYNKNGLSRYKMYYFKMIHIYNHYTKHNNTIFKHYKY